MIIKEKTAGKVVTFSFHDPGDRFRRCVLLLILLLTIAGSGCRQRSEFELNFATIPEPPSEVLAGLQPGHEIVVKLRNGDRFACLFVRVGDEKLIVDAREWVLRGNVEGTVEFDIAEVESVTLVFERPTTGSSFMTGVVAGIVTIFALLIASAAS